MQILRLVFELQGTYSAIGDNLRLWKRLSEILVSVSRSLAARTPNDLNVQPNYKGLSHKRTTH
jgi:hypothetical protein